MIPKKLKIDRISQLDIEKPRLPSQEMVWENGQVYGTYLDADVPILSIQI